MASICDLQLELITSLDGLDRIGDEWQATYTASDATPYSSFAWVRSYVATVDEPGTWCVCVARDSDGAVAILPLMFKRRAFSTHVTILAGGQSPGNTMVLTERAAGRGLLPAALAHVRARLGRWDYCDFHTVAENSHLFAEVQAVTAEHAAAAETTPAGTNVRILLPDSWETFAKDLSSAHRQNVSRRRRGLERQGHLEYVRFGPGDRHCPEALGAALEDAIRICRASWQGSSTEGKAMCDPDQVGFFRDVTQAAAAAGTLDFSLLRLDAQPISYLWGMAKPPVTNITALGYLPELQDASPGLVHLALHIERSIERGFAAIDFGHRYAEYKRRWSKAGYAVHDVLWFARPQLSRIRKRMQERWSGSVVQRFTRWRRRWAPTGSGPEARQQP